MMLLALLCVVALARAKQFRWKDWMIKIQIEENGDVYVVERMGIDFYYGSFSFGYRSVPIGFRGRNDGLDVSSIEVNEIIEQNGMEGVQAFKKSRSWSSKPYTFQVKKVKLDEIKIHFDFPSTSGLHIYELKYRVKGGVQILDDNGLYQLFWKVIPPDHPAEIMNTKIEVTTPHNSVVNFGDMIVGGYDYHKMHISSGSPTVSSIDHRRPIYEDTMAEVRVEFKIPLSVSKIRNEWQDSLRQGNVISFLLLLFALCLPLIPLLIGYFFYRGETKPTSDRDRNLEPIPNILYAQPIPRDGSSDLTISEFGHLLKNGSKIECIMAQIVDLALKGHIRIISEEGGEFLFTKLDENQRLHRDPSFENNNPNNINISHPPQPSPEEDDEEEEIDWVDEEEPGIADRESLQPHEHKLMNYLFYTRNQTLLSDLKYRFSQHLSELYIDIENSLVEKGYRKQTVGGMRKRWMFLYIIIDIVTIFVGFMYGEWYLMFFGLPIYLGWLFFGILFASVVGMGCVILWYNTDSYRGNRERVKGVAFKRYMERILEADNPESRLHRDLFERYLPYAILFGLEKKWSGLWAKTLEHGNNNNNDGEEDGFDRRRRMYYGRRGYYHSCYYYNDYFFYRSWYGVRTSSSSYGSRGSRSAFNNNNLFSGEGFGSRFSSMISSTKTTLTSVKPSKSGGSSGGSSGGRSGGGGSAGFG